MPLTLHHLSLPKRSPGIFFVTYFPFEFHYQISFDLLRYTVQELVIDAEMSTGDSVTDGLEISNCSLVQLGPGKSMNTAVLSVKNAKQFLVVNTTRVAVVQLEVENVLSVDIFPDTFQHTVEFQSFTFKRATFRRIRSHTLTSALQLSHLQFTRCVIDVLEPSAINSPITPTTSQSRFILSNSTIKSMVSSPSNSEASGIFVFHYVSDVDISNNRFETDVPPNSFVVSGAGQFDFTGNHIAGRLREYAFVVASAAITIRNNHFAFVDRLAFFKVSLLFPPPPHDSNYD